jgi:hypothetical protein
MRIVGEWLVCNDGVTRPSLEAKVQAADGSLQCCVFLVDSCADRTVLGPDLLQDLGFPSFSAHEGMTLQVITGGCGFVQLTEPWKTLLPIEQGRGCTERRLAAPRVGRPRDPIILCTTHFCL